MVKEALIAACLTAAMILVFLGSWRSTLIIAVSIPLSILVSLLLLDALGYTLNVMTLGGLSLAVGILVDDATVELENMHRNLGIDNKSLTRAVLDGAQQIAVPAFVATLSICIVFVSVVFLTGPAKFLFVPLALAVVFAMMTSYLLSRTLVPVMVHFLLEPGGGALPRGSGARSTAARPRKKRGAQHDGTAAQAARGSGTLPLEAADAERRPRIERARTARLPVGEQPQARGLGTAGGRTDGENGPRPKRQARKRPAHKDWVWRIHERFNRHFEKFRSGYEGMLAWALDVAG